ncbi:MULTISPECIES: trimeric intracellular cation channel family protein [unclassified Streptomyces]|uniref:trimeric intracellular cation channel family protein n=1 Tax=unclassified Streptomyces TaxID=2593676 RepID=UPI0040429770
MLPRTRRPDPFGFLVVGIASGPGGGMFRDTLLQPATPVALTDDTCFTVATAGFRSRPERPHHRLGFHSPGRLGAERLGGSRAQKTLAAGLGRLPAVLLGTITAVGGGVIRDLLLARTPSIFGGTPLYATVAIVVSSVMVLCSRLGTPTVGVLAGITVGIAPRMAAFTWGWKLPGSRDWRPGSSGGRDP